jgi:hypothetical protein
MQTFKQYLAEDLRKWFKQKWVRMDTKGNIKGDCAREPGEGKPKCLPQAKAHAIGKEARATAARRKRREDPNPERRGAPINVKTEEVNEALTRDNLFKQMADTLKRPEKPGPNKPGTPGGAWKGPKKDDYGYTGYQGHGMPTDKQERELDRKKKDVDEACWDGYTAKGMKKKGNRMVPNCVPEETDLKDRFKKYIKSAVKTTPKIEKISNPAGRTTDHVEYKVTEPTGMIQRFKSKREAQAHFDSLKEDGAMGGSAGPTNVVSSGAIAGTGRPNGGEPGVYLPRRKKSPVMMSIRRKPPKA